MKIYISGITGTGMGPLALMAKMAGMEVCGSDLGEGAILPELLKAGITVKIGPQDGEFLREKIDELDWFIYTSALPENHPELMLVRQKMQEDARKNESGETSKKSLRISKRDELTAYLIKKLGLKLVAVAGTHGKTTTTAMIVFAALKLGLPISYLVGTTLGFAPSGAYDQNSKYFIYEADEYDRNFLKFHPWRAVIVAVSYDHADIYKTPAEYRSAFAQFRAQSSGVIELGKSNSELTKSNSSLEESESSLENEIKLAGAVRRKDAVLALKTILEIAEDASKEISPEQIVETLRQFPGAGRRFEKIAEGIYSDYAHHPEEIAATMEIAMEEAKLRNKKGVVVAYQPHQNIRQHQVFAGYKKAFLGAEKILWLPTYLVREDPKLKILEPKDFIESLENKDVAEAFELDNQLAERLKKYQTENYLVILMTAGPADKWLRQQFQDK